MDRDNCCGAIRSKPQRVALRQKAWGPRTHDLLTKEWRRPSNHHQISLTTNRSCQVHWTKHQRTGKQTPHRNPTQVSLWRVLSNIIVENCNARPRGTKYYTLVADYICKHFACGVAGPGLHMCDLLLCLTLRSPPLLSYRICSFGALEEAVPQASWSTAECTP